MKLLSSISPRSYIGHLRSQARCGGNNFVHTVKENETLIKNLSKKFKPTAREEPSILSRLKSEALMIFCDGLNLEFSLLRVRWQTLLSICYLC